jgi:hypothetical protein
MTFFELFQARNQNLRNRNTVISLNVVCKKIEKENNRKNRHFECAHCTRSPVEGKYLLAHRICRHGAGSEPDICTKVTYCQLDVQELCCDNPDVEATNSSLTESKRFCREVGMYVSLDSVYWGHFQERNFKCKDTFLF